MSRPVRVKIRPIRRVVQIGVLSFLIIIPYLTSNHLDWSPSRIVLGHLPEPRIFPVTGDLWSMSIGNLKLVHPVAFIETTISTKRIYIPLILSVIIPLLITIILGRVFCSWLCPVGFILELNQKVNRFFKKMGLHKTIRITDIRYIILFIALVLSFFLAFPLISIFDPSHMLGRELMYIFTHNAFSLTGVGILLGILSFEMFSTSRAWCNYLCPSGGALSLLGSGRLWRIRMDKERCTHCHICNDACPYYLEPMRLAEEQKFDGVKCDNCGLCRDQCPEGAISYTIERR
jgi:ferredoxin-type protein NapH